MRCSEGKAMLYWLAGAMTLLLASVQPALAACEAPDWNDKTLTIDKTDYESHVRNHVQFTLKKSFGKCGVTLKPAGSWHPDYKNLPFICEDPAGPRG